MAKKTYTAKEAKAYLEMQQEKSRKYMQKFLDGKWQPTTTLPEEWKEAVKTAAGGNVSGYIKKLIEADLKEKGLI